MVQQLASVVTAQAESAPASGGWGESGLLLPVIMVAIFYVVLILPSQKERKKLQSMIDNLKRNDEVITTSGLFGTITDVTDKTFTLEIAKNVKIRVLKSAVARKAEDVLDAKSDEKGSKEQTAPKS